MSHPSWVRELKLFSEEDKKLISGRTPRGCVN